MQHYSFAVQAFVEMVRRFGMERYEFSIYETQTYNVIENVKNFRSELGILYLNDFNRKVLGKIFEENNLEFHELFDCQEYVYLWSGHPLAKKKEITLEDLEDYPFLSFDQGSNNSFYFAEEVFSTYEYKQSIKANDRATMLNLMKGLNGYTLCSGIICEKSEWFGVLRGKALHRRNHDDRISETEGDSVKFDRKGISERDQ